MKWLGSSSNLSLGLDIGSNQIKVVLLDKSNAELSLLRCFMVPLRDNIIINHEIQDVEAFHAAIQVVRRRLPKKVKIAAIAISGSGVMNKVVTMDPSLSDKDVAWQIQAQAESLIPFPLSEVYIDYERLLPSEANGKDNKVLLSVCRMELIESRVDALFEFGIDVNIVDVEPYAMARCHLLLDKSVYQRKVCLMICLGHQSLQMAIINNGATVFTAQEAIGIKQCIEQMTAYMPEDGQQVFSLNKLTVTPEQMFIINNFIEELLQVIRQQLQLYFSSASNENLDQILVCGGGASLIGFNEQLQQQMNIETCTFNPRESKHLDLSRMSREFETDLSQYVTALGLALRGGKYNG